MAKPVSRRDEGTRGWTWWGLEWHMSPRDYHIKSGEHGHPMHLARRGTVIRDLAARRSRDTLYVLTVVPPVHKRKAHKRRDRRGQSKPR